MKVLEKKPFWVFACCGCGSKLEAEVSDVRVGYFGGSYCENGERKYYVSCPVCGAANILPGNKGTSLVENEVAKKGGKK